MTKIDLSIDKVDDLTFVDILAWFKDNGVSFEFRNITQCIVEMDEEDAIAIKL
jgi:hypothetical protein